MAINQLSQSNTFQQWLISTTQLIALANSLTDGGPAQTFVVNTNLRIVDSLNVNGNLISTNLFSQNANINSLNVNTITFYDGTTLNTGTLITTLNTSVTGLTTTLVSAYNHSNAAFDKANAANSLAQSAFDLGNTANSTAQAAFDKANTGDALITASFDKANSANVLAQASFNKANSANVLAQAAFDKANTETTSANVLNATNNTTSTALYPVMVGVAGADALANVTTTKFVFNASTGRMSLAGPYLTTGASGGIEFANRTGGTTARYSLYSTSDIFYVYDHTSATNRVALSSSGTLSVISGGLGVGTVANPGTGGIFATDNITAYYSSDKRLKTNIRDIPNALEKVEFIGGKLFDWTDEYIQSKGGEDSYFNRKSDFGVIAQDVMEVFPEAVRERSDGILAVDYEKMCALAFQAIKELKQQIDQLKKKEE